MHVKVLISHLLHRCYMGALSEAWALAIEALYQIESRRLNERLALLEASKRLSIQTATAIGLAHKLVIETVRRQNYIDALIGIALRQSETEPKLSLGNLNPRLRAFLRLFTYESKTSESVTYERMVKLAEIGRSILGWRRMMMVESTLGLLWGSKESTVLQGHAGLPCGVMALGIQQSKENRRFLE